MAFKNNDPYMDGYFWKLPLQIRNLLCEVGVFKNNHPFNKILEKIKIPDFRDNQIIMNEETNVSVEASAPLDELTYLWIFNKFFF